jgi:hypothetical protein
VPCVEQAPLGAFAFFCCFSALGNVSAIERIENWSLKICHLSSHPYRHDAARTLRSLVAVGRILGKSIATAKAGRKPGPGEEPEKRLPMTNDKFSMTNSQSRISKSQRIPSPTGLTQNGDVRPAPPRPAFGGWRGAGSAVSLARMFEKIKVQLPEAAAKVAHLRRFL